MYAFSLWCLPGELLLDFFVFYSKFDFASDGISLKEGASVPRLPDFAENPLFIENYFLADNVARNVTTDTVNYFQKSCTEAAKILERSLAVTPGVLREWGVIALLQHTEEVVQKPQGAVKQSENSTFILFFLSFSCSISDGRT